MRNRRIRRDEQCAAILVEGLRKLEYRGYDSAGVAVVGRRHGLDVVRATGKLEEPRGALGDEPLAGTHRHRPHPLGHARPALRRERPPAQLRRRGGGAQRHHREPPRAEGGARGAGATSSLSETDTEIFAHLIADELRGRRGPRRTRCAPPLAQVQGTYALAVVCAKRPGRRIVAAKNASPLVVGPRRGRELRRLRRAALLEHTRDVIFLEEGELAVLSRAGRRPVDREGRPASRARAATHRLDAGDGREGRPQALHAQGDPRAAARASRTRCAAACSLERGRRLPRRLRARPRMRPSSSSAIDAAGLRHLAGTRRWSASSMIEALARIPVEVELASRVPLPRSARRRRARSASPSRQSGETADTLARCQGGQGAAARARWRSATWSAARSPREADGALYTHAGPEIGVASTKAFTTQLAALFLLAVQLGRLRGTLDAQAGAGAPRRADRSCRRWSSDVLECEARDQADRAALQQRARLPLPRPRPAVPGRARGRAQAEGDLVHPRRGLRRAAR